MESIQEKQTTVGREPLQARVTAETAKQLRDYAHYADKSLGEVIESLVADHLPKIRIEAL